MGDWLLSNTEEAPLGKVWPSNLGTLHIPLRGGCGDRVSYKNGTELTKTKGTQATPKNYKSQEKNN